ncbi:mobilization protein [Streptomyces albus]|nr:mobilization protein [Streptomyces albus]
MAGAPDPGRDEAATLTQLAHRLDTYVDLRARELDGMKPPQHVWHCPVRTAPGDRYLTDDDWAEVARRVVHATGIAPEEDAKACRWIAVRHAEDHIHILATTVRADGRRPRTNRDGSRAQKECRQIEQEFGLRRLKSGDRTAPRTPTSAEQAKAQRRGHSATSREWLRDQAYAVLAAARTEEEYFDVLDSLGIRANKRIGPISGEVIGYSLAAPDDTNVQGQPVWYGGSKLAPDLSINRIRETLVGQEPSERPTVRIQTGNPWQEAETRLRSTQAILGSPDDAASQAHLAAFGDLLHDTAMAVPAVRAQTHSAATTFNRARRSGIRADHQRAAALRSAAKELLNSKAAPEGTAVIDLLVAATYVVIAAARWHEKRGHEQQAAAAEQSLIHLRTAYDAIAQPALADLARRAPRRHNTDRYAAAVRQAVPDQAERILTDPAWPALTTALAQAESAGYRPGQILTQAAGERELDTARSAAEVLTWRIVNAPSRRASAATARTRGAVRPTADITRQSPVRQHVDGRSRRPRR